jgi:hypothetical protein
MGANSESLHQGKLVEAELRGLVQQRQGNGKQALHPTIDMDSDHPQLFAAIPPAGDTGLASAATDVGLNRTAVAGSDSKFVRPGFHHNPRQLVAEHPGISVDRVSSSKGMEVATTHSNFMNPDNGCPRGKNGSRYILFQKFPWSPKNDLSHRNAFLNLAKTAPIALAHWSSHITMPDYRESEGRSQEDNRATAGKSISTAFHRMIGEWLRVPGALSTNAGPIARTLPPAQPEVVPCKARLQPVYPSRFFNADLHSRKLGGCLDRYGFSCHQQDRRRSARQATKYLVQCGHRNLAVITGPSLLVNAVERLNGFRKAWSEAGMAPPKRIVLETELKVRNSVVPIGSAADFPSRSVRHGTKHQSTKRKIKPCTCWLIIVPFMSLPGKRKQIRLRVGTSSWPRLYVLCLQH